MKTFTEAPERLGEYGVLHTGEGQTLEIAALRVGKGGDAVVRFRGIDDRAAAEQLVNAKLLIERDALPATAPDEFYHADLIGMRVQDGEGRVIGAVCAIHNFGAGDVIELERSGGGTLLLPFSRDFVPRIDFANGYIIVSGPKDIEARDRRGVE